MKGRFLEREAGQADDLPVIPTIPCSQGVADLLSNSQANLKFDLLKLADPKIEKDIQKIKDHTQNDPEKIYQSLPTDQSAIPPEFMTDPSPHKADREKLSNQLPPSKSASCCRNLSVFRHRC